MEELDLKELITMFWNKKLHIILITAIFMLVGIIYTLEFVTPQYTSSTTLLLTTSSSSSSKDTTITTTDITLNSKLVSTYSELVTSKNIVRQVITNLGISEDEEEEIRENVTVTSVKDTELIEIAVTNTQPEKASKIANEIAKVFMEKVSTEFYNIDNIHVVDVAEVEEIPSNVNHLKDIMIFVFVGLVVSVGYVLVANMLDTTIKSVEDVERQFNITVLASIPMCTAENQKGGKK